MNGHEPEAHGGAPPGDLAARLERLTPERRRLLERLLSERAASAPADAPPAPAPADAATLPPPAAAARGEGPVPLSYEQERMWFLHELDPADSSYHLHLQLVLPDGLSVDAWTDAWRTVVGRHEALRTQFVAQAGRPVQQVLPALEVDIARLDLRPHGRAGWRAHAARLAAEQAEAPFDLARAPLFRLALLRIDGRWLHLVTLHHIVADGWSIDILQRELDLAYAARLRGAAPALPPLPIQFADFAQWQRRTLVGDRLDGLLRHWRAVLQDLPALELPTDRRRPESFSGRAGIRQRRLPAGLRDALQGLARREGCTLFAVLLTGFVILLHRCSGQRDIVLGTPVANREQPGVEGLIGFFLNTILLRVRFEAGCTVRALLQNVRDAAKIAFDHQQLPFARLVEALQPTRDLRRNPLYQATFQLLRSQNRSARADASIEDIGYRRPATNVDLAVDLFDGSDALLCRFEYSTDLFDDATVERMLEHWERVLDAVTRHADVPIDRLALVTATERERLLGQWACGPLPATGRPSLTEMLANAARAHADRPAVIGEHGGLSYRALGHRSDRLAAWLRRHGAAPRRIVALRLSDPVRTVQAIWAAWKTGAAFVFLDPEWPRERLDRLRADAEPVCEVDDDCAAFETDRHAPGDVDRGSFGLDDEPLDPDRHDSDQAIAPVAAPDRAAAVFYTSGSSGTPKGVVLGYDALAAQASWMLAAWPLGPGDRVAQKYSFAFDAALAEMLAALTAGAALVPDPGRGRDLDELVGLIARHDVTHLDIVPSVLAVMLDHPLAAGCRALRRIVCGGERLAAELVARVAAAWPSAELINAYGPTECTITATSWRCGPDDARRDPPIGRPVAGLRAYVLDPAGQLVPPGMQGELHLAGVGLARGYLGDAQATRARFVAHPFEPRGRAYATGDRVRWRADGALDYLGRLDRQIKVHGVRIEPEEIERALLRHPCVQQAALVVCPVAPALDAEAGRRLDAIERLTEQEASFLLRFETDQDRTRERTMWRKTDDFELYLHLPRDAFVPARRPAQRNWLLQRALDELAGELHALDEAARRCVPGSERPPIGEDWQTSRARYQPGQLIIDGQQVMQDWERPLMEAMADIAGASHGDVLEVGFGMGLSASALQRIGVRSHTILEANRDVAEAFESWRAAQARSPVRLCATRWQDWDAPDEAFDGVLFDAYPTSEQEYADDVVASATYAAAFFPTAAKVLRPGGRFTYYSNEIDALGRAHQRLLLRHFSSFAVRVVRGLSPPPDCQYWWADSMVVVEATR